MGVRDFAKQRKEKTQAAYASPNLSETRPAAAERPALTGVRAYAAQKNKNADAVVRPFDAEKASQMLFETSEAGRAARAASLVEKAAKKAEREEYTQTAALAREMASQVKETRRAGNPKYNEDYVPGVDYPKIRSVEDIESELGTYKKQRSASFEDRFPDAEKIARQAIGGKDADADRQLRELAQQYADENAAYDARIAELKKEVKDSKNKTVLQRRERATKQTVDTEQTRFSSPELRTIDEKIKNAEAELSAAESAQMTVEDAERALREYEDELRANGVSEQYFGEDSRYIELAQAAGNAKKSAASQKNAADANLYALRGAKTLASVSEEDRAAILSGVRVMRGNSAAGMNTSIPQTFDFSTGKYRVLTEDEYKQIKADYNAAIRRLKESGVSDADIRRMTTTLEQSADAMIAAGGNVQTAAFALQYPTLASAISVVSNLASGVTVGGAEIGRVVGNAFRGEGYKAPMNINGAAYAPVRATNDIRGTIAERIEEGNGFGGKVGSFAYQTLMSTADSVVASVLGNVGGAAAIGGSAFASAIVDAKESGVPDEQALMTGICAGIFETLFERVSIGNFNKLKELPPATVRDVAMNVVKSTLVNASEEGATEIANILADTIINGDYSGYAEAYNAYINAGKSRDEATRLALLDMTKQVGMAAFGGAVQGGFMGGIGSAWGYFGNRDANRATGSWLSDGGKVDRDFTAALVRDGMENGSEETQRYAKTLDGKEADERQAGQLARMIAADGGKFSNVGKEIDRRTSDTEARTADDIRTQLGDAANGDAVAAALYQMQIGKFSERDAETVRNSPEGRALFSEHFDTDITENTSVDEISAAVRDVSGDDYRSISYEAQQLLKSVRASNGYSDGADAAFYRAYFEGFSGKARSESKILSTAALVAAYQMGVDAKKDIGTFHTVGNASLSKETTAFFSRAAKDLGLSITYGGKGSVKNGGVRRGYTNSYSGIHIYEDAKVTEISGNTLVGGDAAARIILGHELTHILQKQSPTQYKAFETFALQQKSEQGNKIGLDLVSEYMQSLRLDKQSATGEVVANYAMRALFSDMKTAREVTKHHSKVAEAIRRAFAWIRDKLGVQTSEIDRASAMWNKAYNESRKNADAAVADAVNRAKGVANSAETGYNGIKNSIAQNNAKLIRYFTGEVRESGDVYLSGRDKTKIAHNVKSGNGWMHKDGKRGWVYTDVCFYTFEFNADHSVTVTEELFLEDDADRIKTIRKEFSSNGYATTVRGNDQTAESKEFRPGVSSKHSLSSDNGRKIGRTVEVHGQESGSGRIRSDRRGGSNSKAISEASEKQNKVKADSAESAFSVGEVKDSIATPSTDSEGIMKLDDANIDKTKEKMTWLEANDLLEKQQGLSYRFYASDDPMSRAGYAMFADDHEQNGDAYGGDKPRAFSVREDDLVPVWELSEKIAEARHETDEYTPWILEDYAELSDEDFADMFNPSDIVDSAYAWDNEELTEWFYNHVAEPNKIGGVKTSDGAIVFDKDLIRRNIPAEIVYTQASSNEEFLAKLGDDTESDPDIRYSVSSTDAIDIDFERRLNAVRGRQTSVSEVLRRNEKEARAVKREFLPDMKTVGEVARSFAEIGLAKDATTAELVKATTDAAVAMRAAYLERRIANEATKDAKSRTAAKKLIEAAEMVKLPDGMSKTQVAAAMADALYQTNTSDRKTVKELVAQYGAIKPGEKPSRTLSVPKRTDEGRNVSEAVRTVLEARVTPDGMVPTIEDAIESGDFSYETITDKASLARAKSKIRRGYQAAYDDFRSAARRGNVSKDQITLGFELYNQAANAGTEEGTRQAMEILADIVSTSRSSAQTLAAMRLLKKMSPDGQLYTVQRTINRINESIGAHKKRQLDRARATVDDAMWNGRADATEEMARSIVQMGHGLPVEEWVDAIGNLVGDGIAARLSPKTKAERLVSQNIKSDILKFAEDYLPRAAGERKSKTAAKRLADYFANKDNYEKVWERAKASIREKYADNPDALEQFDAFLVGTLSNNVADSSVMLSAIAKAAISEDSSIQQTALRATLGDADGVALDIYNRLNQTVQAVGDDAVVLRDAILRYVRETAAEKATPQAVENEIRRAVREAGTTIGEIIRSDALERASVLRRIQSYLIENLGISADAAGEAAETIRQNFTKMTEEKSRAALEATLKDKPRSVRKTAEERFREYANLGAFEGEYNEAISKKLFGETVRINEKLVQKFRAAETEEQRTEILKDIYRDVGRQIPSTWLEKWTAWRYLSMLFNPTTHIRNVVGNAGFVPIVMAKNKVAWIAESLYGWKHKDFEKTKAFIGKSNDLVKAADADFLKYQEALFDGGKYRDEVNANKYIDEGRHIFRDTLKIGDKGVLNHFYDFNSWALSAEDMVFKKQYYVYALASWCKTHGITAEQIRRGEGLDAARAYAIREAQRNTYNDANAFSDILSRRTGNAVVDTAVSAIMPFRRTPANILARGLEYSPAGLLWTITRGAYQLRNGEISAAQYIDNLAQGLTGTMILVLGAFLAHLGIIGFGGDDDKEKDFEKMYGHQQYSIEIGGKSITLDWLAPESIPFFTGVNMYELMQDGGFSLDDIVSTIELVTDPMLNMSMLQGMNDMIENAKWSNTSALGAVATGALESLISQNFPTLLGKLERITQPDRMTTYVDKNKWMPAAAQKTLGKLSQKVPGLDYNQIPYIDAWGEKETNTNAAWRAFDQLMNPAYTATVDSTPLEQEIIRLHRATNKNDMFPTRAQKSFTVKRRKDGKPLNGDEKDDEVEAVDFNLTAEQYVKYATYRGKASKRIAEALIKSPYYKKADNKTRREMFAAAYDVADAQAKMLVSDYRPDGWVAKAISSCKETGITEMQYITLHQQNKNINGKYGGESIDNLAGARKMQMLYKATLSDAQRARLADDFDVGKTVRGWDEAYTEKFLSWYKEG